MELMGRVLNLPGAPEVRGQKAPKNPPNGIAKQQGVHSPARKKTTVADLSKKKRNFHLEFHAWNSENLLSLLA